MRRGERARSAPFSVVARAHSACAAERAGRESRRRPHMQHLEAPEQIKELVKLAGQAAHAHACSLYLLDASGQALIPFVVHGLPPDYVVIANTIGVGEQACGRAVKFGRPWVVSDIQSDGLFVAVRPLAEQFKLRAAFPVPVFVLSANPIGAMACYHAVPYTAPIVDVGVHERDATAIVL